MTLKWTWTFGLGLAVLTAAGLGAQSTLKAQQGAVADLTYTKDIPPIPAIGRDRATVRSRTCSSTSATAYP